MEFRILGPLEVRDDGHLVELRRHKQRALLAFLLLHAGEWLSADALIEALWGEHSPKTARAALQGYIAQLRRALGRELIVSQDGGYRLEIDAEQLDLCRFDHLIERARTEEPRERLELLREALALWRGPALADFLYEPFADHEATRLEELRTAALEELVDAELLLGAGPTLVERLEALIAEHPYRERLRGQLMLALYRSGRQVEALECYRAARQTLTEELGVEPGATLRELQQLILCQDASLESQQAELQAALPLAERRKTVTVLFADLAFARDVDPELRRGRSQTVLRQVRAVLEAHGGSIEQRASEELMGVFGLPLAHEDDALRAARAALELQAASEGSVLRLALESGEVLAGVDEAGHGFVSGAVVPLARQLLDLAAPGEVLVGEGSLRLLGGSALTTSPPSGAPEGSGRLVRVEEAGTTAPATPLADRKEDLAVLRAAFAGAVEERQGRLLLVLGEAGIGKTRVAAELTAQLEGRATIVQGRCLSYGQALTYWPLVEALRSLGEPARAALERLVEGGATSPQQLAWTVQRALERVAAERPLVLVVEDLHWAEPALLELLLGLSAKAPMLLLCLARPELLERHPKWAELESLRLGPLPRADADALLRAVAQPVAATQRRRLVARAAGNPLFLEELSAFLTHGGSAGALPPRLQVLLQARLDLLPERQRLLLATAALEGVVFHRGALEALLPEDEEVGARLDALGRTLLIRPWPSELEGEQGYRFRHQLIRDTAYGALPKAERARLHEALADWLAHHSGTRAELDDIVAYHLEQAALARRELDTADLALDRRAAEALAAGAARARRRVDLRAAADLLRRALALLPDGDPRVPELELELGLVLTPLGEPEESRRRLEHAEQSAADPCVVASVRLARLLERLHFEPEGTPAAVRRASEQAIPLFERRGDHRALARAWYTLAVAEVVELRMQAAADAYARAAEHADLAGDRPLEALALAERIGFLGATRIPFSEAVLELERVVVRFPGEPPLEAGLLLFQAEDAYQHGRRQEARARGLKAIDLAHRSGYTLFAGVWLAALAFAELNGGDIEEAERLARDATDELERHHERSHLSWVKTILAEIRVVQGRLRDALELADEAEQIGGPHDRGTLVAANVARARAYLTLGRAHQARAAAARAVSVAESKDSLVDQAHAQFALAQVLVEANERRAALSAAEEADRLYAELDRALLRRRVTALINEIERETADVGAPV